MSSARPAGLLAMVAATLLATPAVPLTSAAVLSLQR
jgi:hypothetical protein